MDFARLEELAIQHGALRESTHALLVSGEHTSGFFSHINLITDYDLQRIFSLALAELLLDFERRVGYEVDTIVGPLLEGGTWGSLVQANIRRLYPNRKVDFVFTRTRYDKPYFVTEKESGRDDRLLVRRKKVAILNEVLSTGVSVGPLVEAVKRHQGVPVVLLTLCDRRICQKFPIDLEVLTIIKAGWPVWAPKDCPLCGKVPLNFEMGEGSKLLVELQKLRGSLAYLSRGEN